MVTKDVKRRVEFLNTLHEITTPEDVMHITCRNKKLKEHNDKIKTFIKILRQEHYSIEDTVHCTTYYFPVNESWVFSMFGDILY